VKADTSPSCFLLALQARQREPRSDKELSPDALRSQLVIESR
jgi:hypothetical protein